MAEKKKVEVKVEKKKAAVNELGEPFVDPIPEDKGNVKDEA